MSAGHLIPPSSPLFHLLPRSAWDSSDPRRTLEIWEVSLSLPFPSPFDFVFHAEYIRIVKVLNIGRLSPE